MPPKHNEGMPDGDPTAHDPQHDPNLEGTDSATPDQLAEEDSQILEQLRQVKISHFGEIVTIAETEEDCPVDLSEYSTAQKINFMARLAIKKGAELSEELAAQLEKRTLRQQKELAEKMKAEKKPEKEIEKEIEKGSDKEAEKAEKEESETKVAAKTSEATPKPLKVVESVPAITAAHAVAPVSHIGKAPEPIISTARAVAVEQAPVDAVRLEATQLAEETLSTENLVDAPQPIDFIELTDLLEPTDFTEAVSVDTTEAPSTITLEDAETADIIEVEPAAIYAETSLTEVTTDAVEHVAENETETQTETETGPEPETVYQSFIDALSELNDLDIPITMAIGVEHTSVEISESAETDETEPQTVSLQHEMVARLETADEPTREAVMPLVIELTEALTSAATLSAEGFAGDLSPEDLESLKQQAQDTITELCIKICKELQIPIDDEAIATLAARILKPDFAISVEHLPTELIEDYDYMHERKTDDQLAFLTDYKTADLARLPAAIGRTLTMAFENKIRVIKNTPVTAEAA